MKTSLLNYLIVFIWGMALNAVLFAMLGGHLPGPVCHAETVAADERREVACVARGGTPWHDASGACRCLPGGKP